MNSNKIRVDRKVRACNMDMNLLQSNVAQHNGFQLDPIYDAQQRLIQPATHFEYIGQLVIRNICKHECENNDSQIAIDFKDLIQRKLSLQGPDFILSMLPGVVGLKLLF